MAKAPAPPQPPEATGPLPLPARVIEHHEQSLGTPMAEWISRERVPPVLLLTGIAGVGKRSMAYYLAQWILCERNGFGTAGGEPAEEATFDMFGGGSPAETAAPAASVQREPRPCGNCGNCQRALHGTWVDFTEIVSEDDEGAEGATGTLKIDQFRKLKASLGFGAHQGRYRVILISNAERMTAQAANSMLKLLEEPPAGWVFLLTAKDATLLLPTIVSRCQTLRLRPFPATTLDVLLREGGVEPGRARIAATLAQGSWSKALALTEAETWERRRAIFQFLRDPKAELGALVDWASSDPGHFDLLLDQLEQSANDLVRWTLAGDAGYEWINQDGRETLERHAQETSRHLGGPAAARAFWLARAERLARARQEALTPLNRKLLIQDVLLPWLAPL